MTKVLTKQVQNKMSSYFSKLSGHLYKPELRCVREMVTGILKNGTMLVNPIASGIQDSLSLSQTTKRIRNHYNKEGFFKKLFKAHLEGVKGKICHGDYILVDGSDIQKKYAKMMEGLDYVKDGDKGSIGLGYWLMDVVHFGRDGEMTPLYNKLYSFDCGARSENLEVKEAVSMVKESIDKKVKYIYDRGMDREILRDFIIGSGDGFILRLKKTTKLLYKGKETSVNAISKKLPLFMELWAMKVKKSKRFRQYFKCGAVKVQYKAGKELVDLWLVVTKREGGGYCWLLTKTPQDAIVKVIEETFKGYGLRWKIEEYHRHIKDCYHLEDIQIKTFEGLQSMLAILTIAMSMVYRELASLHIKLLLESGVKTLNKEKVYELHNFVYYKISKILKVLLAHIKPRAFLPDVSDLSSQLQLSLPL